MVLNNNPISLHHSGSITSAQLDACNTLLTQLALIVDQLEKLVSFINHIKVQNNSSNKDVVLNPVQSKWHYLLIDIKTVVLPELYVVFNDPTTLMTVRRRLYDMTQAIYYAFNGYL